MTSVLYDFATILELIHSEQVTESQALILSNLLYYSLSTITSNASQSGPYQETFTKIKKLSMSCMTLPKMRAILTMHSNNAAMVTALLKSFLLVLCHAQQAGRSFGFHSDQKVQLSAEPGQIDSASVGGSSMLIGNE